MSLRRSVGLLGFFLACSGPSPGAPPSVTDAAVDRPAACAELTRIHSVYPPRVFLGAGRPGTVLLRLARDRNACGARYVLETADGRVARGPSEVRIERGGSVAEVALEATGYGVTTLTARQVEPPDPEGLARAAVEVHVPRPLERVCEGFGGTLASGMLQAGVTVETRAGHAGVRVPERLVTFPRGVVSIQCGSGALPEGYEALGPAVSFTVGAQATTRLPGEVEFRVPVDGTRLPPLWQQHVELVWSPLGAGAPRVVPVAATRVADDGLSLTFHGYRLGTYRAVARAGLGRTLTRRRFVHRAILGISMGAVGASMIASRHPELFDSVVPLGGAADSALSGSYIRRWVLGGFCTEAERARLGDARCATSSVARTEPADDFNIAVQDYEHFFAPPGRGTGGTFDRRARFQGFRDIGRMFGNPAMPTDPREPVLPLGVDPSELARSDEERCARPVVLGGPDASLDARFYDDEYDPDGRFAAITFCDGGSLRDQPGVWDRERGTYPTELFLAIDRNGNGRRDPGEPVVRDFSEPTRDWGTDGLPSAEEPGYNSVTNPDPNADDYDRVYNPAGAEGNLRHDPGEPYEDVGLDGVRCPAGRRCPYDRGEGNGTFDAGTTHLPGSDRLDPRALVARLPREEARRLSLWMDGGLRDALQFGVNANHFAGAVAQQRVGLTVYENFAGLVPFAATGRAGEATYRPQDVDWARVPSHVLLRYGDPDATREEVLDGDGAHVGTNTQLQHRLFSALQWAASRWPDADHAVAPLGTTQDNENRCRDGYSCAFEFRSERARRAGPVSVFLPPGYHDPDHRGLTYPVLFFLHGYGMQPSDLAASGLLVSALAGSAQSPSWARPGKFIMVFPDGRCRPGDGCLEGTFFVDSVAGRAQLESFFLDLYEWVGRTYRAAPPAELEVRE
ncbi:MAG: hypothetical protein HY909_21030 [Deltaproteobacteria bacterium]|nr:hypothetical protein [Deltaproteobacteria bacterium]